MNVRFLAIRGAAGLALGLASGAGAQGLATAAGSAAPQFNALALRGILASHGNTTQTRWLRRGMPSRIAPPPIGRPILYRAGRSRVLDRTRAHHRHFEQDAAGGLFTIDAMRTRRSRSGDEGDGKAGRFSMWSADGGYLVALGEHDIVRLGATIAAEKHNSLVALTSSHATSTTRTIGLEWRRDSGAGIQLARFQTLAPSSLTIPERDSLLAAGSPAAEQGYHGSIEIPLHACPARGCAIRLDLTKATLDRADALALGASQPGYQRASLAVELRF